MRLLGEELRLEIEKEGGSVKAAEMIINKSVELARQETQNALREIQSLVGPHGRLSRVQSGGVNITPAGINVFEDGVIKTTIFPDGNFRVGSDITDPLTTTFNVFVNDQTYNSEEMGAGDLMVGNNSSDASNLFWDASEGKLNFRLGVTPTAYMDTDGTLNFLSGTIGGWTIGADYIRDTAGTVGMSSAVTGGTDVRFWAGDVTPDDAPFQVTEDGELIANNADITGNITATEGLIGGWEINDPLIHRVIANLGIILNSSTQVIEVGNVAGSHILIDGANEYIRTSTYNPGVTGFNIDTDTGDAEFNNATMRGTIYATAGAIGGWTIGASALTDTAGVVGLSSAVTGGDDIRLWAGHATPASAPFRVTEAGVLVASSATITGSITSTSGAIAGWTIGANTIQKLASNIGIVIDSATPKIQVGDTAGTHLVLDGANQRIRSSNFVTGSAGFNIAADTGDAEFNNITARGELKTFLLTSSNQMAVGGNIIVSKDAGKLGADVTAIATTVNFGKAMTVGDWIKIQGPDATGTNALEAMLVGSNVSGFTYNVTRNVDGSGANAWLKDTPFVVLGSNGSSRIEIVAGASGSIQLITQGAAYGTTTVQASMSTVAGAITAGGGVVTIDVDGIWIENQQAAFGFEDTSGNRDKIYLSSSATNDLDLYNQVGGKQIGLRVDTAAHTVLDLTFGEDSVVTGAALLSISPPSGKAIFQFSSGIIMYSGIDSATTVFNEDSFDIDHRFEGATDADLLFLEGGTDRVGIGTSAPGAKLEVAGGVIINEAGGDFDVRIEGDTNANLFFTDASTDRVGIKTNTPGSVLDVAGSFQCDSITNDTGLAHGTYAPTCTAVANVDSTSAVTDFTYMRVGNSVLVSGNINIDATTITTLTRVRVSLPVASDLTNAGDLTGTGGIQGSDDVVIAIGDITNNAAEINYTCNGTANTVVRILFMYVVK